MVAVGLYIRLSVETPAFQRLVAEARIEKAPVWEVVKRQPKEIILSALARTAEQAPAYIYLAFVFAYGTQVLHAPRNFLLTSLMRPVCFRSSRSQFPVISRIGSDEGACIYWARSLREFLASFISPC